MTESAPPLAGAQNQLTTSQAKKQTSHVQADSQQPGLRADAENPPYVEHRQYVRRAGVETFRGTRSKRVKMLQVDR